jgi:hypothetical protein
MGQARRQLPHLVFWVALGLLVLNDHVLKRGHVLPGVLTGKLSDFAGLIVAPVLVMAALRVRGRAGRAAVFVSIYGMFASIKLSRSAADLVEWVTARTPLPWKLWADPTDLVALLVLPAAWWLAAQIEVPRLALRPRFRLHVAEIFFGLLACAATSTLQHEYVMSAYLVNATSRTQEIRIHRVRGPLDCSRGITSPALWPGPEAFTLETCARVGSDKLIPLSQYAQDLGTSGEKVDASSQAEPTCDAVLLEANGLEPVVVSWNGIERMTVTMEDYEIAANRDDDPHAIYLEPFGDRLVVQGTKLLQVQPAGFQPAPATCPNGER